MSKINVVFDTEEKTCVVTLDGVVLDNISSVSVYKYKNSNNKERSEINISMYEVSDDGDLFKNTTIYASKAEAEQKNINDLQAKTQKHLTDNLSKECGKMIGIF